MSRNKIVVIALLLLLVFAVGCGMRECFACNGTGKDECPYCNGDGTLTSNNKSITCPYCKGEGRAGTCDVCDGTGKIKKHFFD